MKSTEVVKSWGLEVRSWSEVMKWSRPFLVFVLLKDRSLCISFLSFSLSFKYSPFRFFLVSSREGSFQIGEICAPLILATPLDIWARTYAFQHADSLTGSRVCWGAPSHNCPDLPSPVFLLSWSCEVVKWSHEVVKSWSGCCEAVKWSHEVKSCSSTFLVVVLLKNRSLCISFFIF